MTGKFRYKVGGIGRDAGKFLHPAGICTDRFGNLFVADRDNHRVQLFDKTGKFIAIVVGDTCTNSTSGVDIRPLDVAVTSQTHLVVLLTGIEGVDCIQIQIYDVRCSLPPPEVRSVQDIVNSMQKLSISDAAASSALMATGSGHKVKFVSPMPDVLGRNDLSWTLASKGGYDAVMNAQKKEQLNSQVCTVS